MSSSEALSKLERQEHDEDTAYLRDLKIIDGIIQSFDKEHPIQRIMKDDVVTGFFDAGIFVEYHYNSVKYTGTIDTKHRFFTGHDANGPTCRRQLTIRLSHDGFRYHDRKGQVFKWMPNYNHGGNGWCALNRESVSPKMTYLRQLCDRLGKGFTYSFLYNEKQKRIDISVFNQRHVCVLKFTFEHGVPEGFDIGDILEWNADMAF